MHDLEQTVDNRRYGCLKGADEMYHLLFNYHRLRIDKLFGKCVN